MPANVLLFLATSGFEARATRVPGGDVIYRLEDRSGHVRVPGPDWDRLQHQLDLDTKAVNRQTRWQIVGLVPAIVMAGLIAPPLAAAFALIGLLPGPWAIYAVRGIRTGRHARAVETALRHYPKAGPPPPVPGRTPRWMKVAIFLLVGPELILQFWGTLNPDAYAGSPWAGMHLELPGIAGLLLLGVVQYRRWRRGRAAEAKLRAALAAGRRVDFVGRAKAG